MTCDLNTFRLLDDAMPINPWVWAIARLRNQRFDEDTWTKQTPRYVTMLHTRLRIWLRRARTEIAYRPGNPGYLRARESIQIRAGQRRHTRDVFDRLLRIDTPARNRPSIHPSPDPRPPTRALMTCRRWQPPTSDKSPEFSVSFQAETPDPPREVNLREGSPREPSRRFLVSTYPTAV